LHDFIRAVETVMTGSGGAPRGAGHGSERQGDGMKLFLLRFFTWWNGAMIGTLFHTRRFGESVGSDEFGNRYYQTRGGKKDPALGIVRRWVIYNGLAEASRIPPGWYGWMHHKTDVVPSADGHDADGEDADGYMRREWELPHRPNLTGTAGAYRPKGSILSANERPSATGDYQPWTPGA
jgi:NADH:ubiquinone oxidoreductase subunit